MSPGSLVIPKRGGAIGTNKKRITTRSCVLDPNLMAISPANELDVQFLYHWFLTFDLASITSGTSVPQLNKQDLNPLLLPLPPVDVQRRIAHILGQSDELRSKREQALRHLDELGNAVFMEMFGNSVTNPRSWPEDAQLGDVAEIVSGITKGRKLNGAPVRTVPYLAVVNVQDRALNLGQVKTIAATEAEIQRYRLQKDDILLTEGGDPDKLGRGTIWSDEIDEAIHQNHIFRVRLTDSRFLPVFVNWVVGSERGKRYFLQSAKQTTGIASINLTQLRGFPLIRPPIELQREFLCVLRHIRKQHATQEAARRQQEALFAALQYRAFRGEL